MEINLIRSGFSLAFNNSKYHTYSTKGFVLKTKILTYGSWVNKEFYFGPKGTLSYDDYISFEKISAISIIGLYYNGQALSLSDWYIESINFSSSYIEAGALSEIDAQSYNEESTLVKELRMNKSREIWFDKDTSMELSNAIEIIFNVQLKVESKVVIIDSTEIDMTDVEIKVYKAKEEDNMILLTSGDKVAKSAVVSPENIQKTYLESIYVTSKDGTRSYAYFDLTNDNLINETYIIEIIKNNAFIADSLMKVIYPNFSKVFFKIYPSYKNNKIFVYDGRIHSLVNPVDDTIIKDAEVKALVKKGFCKLPINPDIDVYSNENKKTIDNISFLDKLDIESILSFVFASINEDWEKASIYECAELIGNKLYKKNVITFDEEGNAYIPLIPREYLLVKNISLVDDEDHTLKTGRINIFNSNGSAYFSDELKDVATIPFVIESSESSSYTFELDDYKMKINPNEPFVSLLNNFDLVSADMLKAEGYKNMYIAPKYRRLNPDALPEIGNISLEQKESSVLDGWWGSIKTYSQYEQRWYESWIDSVSNKIPQFDKKQEETATEPNVYFEIEVRHSIDGSLVMDSYIRAREITVEQTDSFIPVVTSSIDFEGTSNVRKLSYGATGKIQIPKAISGNIEVLVDSNWAQSRGFKIKKGSEVLNRFNHKVVLYVEGNDTTNYSGFGIEGKTDLTLMKEKNPSNYKRIEVRDVESKELIKNAIVKINGSKKVLVDGFSYAQWDKLLDIPIENLKEIIVDSDWASSEGYKILAYNNGASIGDDFSKIGFFFNEDEKNNDYRTNILWVKKAESFFSTYNYIPSKVFFKIKLATDVRINAAKSYMKFKYLSDSNVFNVKDAIKSILDTMSFNIQNMKIGLTCSENTGRMTSGLVTTLKKDPQLTLTLDDILTATKRVRDIYVITKSHNYFDIEFSDPMKIIIKRDIDPTMIADDKIMITDESIEVAIARYLAANPDDIYLEDYDKIEMTQKTLNEFVYCYNIEKGNPIYGSILRDLTFSGDITIEGSELSNVDLKENTGVFSMFDIRKAISSDVNLPTLKAYYNQCLSFNKIASDNAVLVTGETEIQVGAYAEDVEITDIDFIVEKDSPYITRKGFEIVNVYFDISGNDRLNNNYLSPVLTADSDGKSKVVGFSPERMVFQVTASVSGSVTKQNDPLAIQDNLSSLYKMKSKLLKEVFTGSEKYIWTVSNIFNKFEEEDFLLYVANDTLYAKTMIEVNKYSGAFSIDVITSKNNKTGVIITKEQLKNYIPKDQFGYVYKVLNDEDYNNIQYILVNESSAITFSWENAETSNRSGVDNVVYELSKPNVVRYTVHKTLTEYIEMDRTLKIVELDKEQLRPVNNETVYDKTLPLSGVLYTLTNKNEKFDIYWENKEQKILGVGAIIIRRIE